eukprot:NODE_353_length_2399_cov_95.375319_g328_i0.p1 GENE.NODE_353_length_2399_cov_95.375319_g328_i0~~NODE_353_length_2399_cov_95.375319_g328_i0.p1  ORF type:complete len:734 (+),score=131.88 NODE_353_length_2399_cov_95.375319_g328_i0:198-2204(+)
MQTTFCRSIHRPVVWRAVEGTKEASLRCSRMLFRLGIDTWDGLWAPRQSEDGLVAAIKVREVVGAALEAGILTHDFVTHVNGVSVDRALPKLSKLRTNSVTIERQGIRRSFDLRVCNNDHQDHDHGELAADDDEATHRRCCMCFAHTRQRAGSDLIVEDKTCCYIQECASPALCVEDAESAYRRHSTRKVRDWCVAEPVLFDAESSILDPDGSDRSDISDDDRSEEVHRLPQRSGIFIGRPQPIEKGDISGDSSTQLSPAACSQDVPEILITPSDDCNSSTSSDLSGSRTTGNVPTHSVEGCERNLLSEFDAAASAGCKGSVTNDECAHTRGDSPRCERDLTPEFDAVAGIDAGVAPAAQPWAVMPSSYDGQRMRVESTEGGEYEPYPFGGESQPEAWPEAASPSIECSESAYDDYSASPNDYSESPYDMADPSYSAYDDPYSTEIGYSGLPDLGGYEDAANEPSCPADGYEDYPAYGHNDRTTGDQSYAGYGDYFTATDEYTEYTEYTGYSDPNYCTEGDSNYNEYQPVEYIGYNCARKPYEKAEEINVTAVPDSAPNLCDMSIQCDLGLDAGILVVETIFQDREGNETAKCYLELDAASAVSHSPATGGPGLFSPPRNSKAICHTQDHPTPSVLKSSSVTNRMAHALSPVTNSNVVSSPARRGRAV